MAEFDMTNRSEPNSEGQIKPANGHHGNETAMNGDAGDGAGSGILPLEEKDVESGQKRHTWSRKVEFILTLIGYCVGLGNVWRFPYVCIRNGGGAFLIPFIICLVVCGMPLFFLEVSLGQFLSRGPFHVWSICPIFKGLGWSMLILTSFCNWYYSIVLSWTVIFLGHSFRSPLPWTVCGQEWNTDYCVSPGNASTNDAAGGDISGNFSMNWVNASTNGSALNTTLIHSNRSFSSSEEFWLHNVLELSPGLEHLNGLPYHTTLALLVTSIVVILCIIKGVHSVGKVVYVTATLPYILLSVLIIKGATLPGAIDGVIFYIKPDFSKLLLLQTWVEASLQVFYSLGPAWGGLITMASYNKFNNNCMRDSIFLAFVCEGTSVFAGFAIFTIVGHMAYRLDVPVANFTSTGPGLAFVVYPEAVSYLPLPQLWGVLFFVMLFTLGLDTQFTGMETFLTAICDIWPAFTRKWNIHVKLLYAGVLFLVSLPLATRGGMYVFQLADWYVGAITLCLCGILECLVVGWIYGAERFLDDIQMMISKRPPYFFVVMWRFATPMLLCTVWVSTLLTYEPPNYEGYTYKTPGVVFGWFLALVSFAVIPTGAIYEFARCKGGPLQRLKTACTPSHLWHPADPKLEEEYKMARPHSSLCSFRSPFTRSKI